MWLALDTRALRIPHAERQANGCLLLYSVLSVAVPALVFGAIFGHIATWLVSLALVAGVVLGVEVLPVWFASAFVLAFLSLLFLHNAVPLPGDPGYLAWAAPLTVVLCATSAQRWLTLHHADLSALNRWWLPGGSAMRTVQMRVIRGNTYASPASNRNTGARDKPSGEIGWRVGPDHPVHSIQLAINPMAAPNAQRALRRFIAFCVVAVVVFLILIVRHAIPASVQQAIAQQLPTFGIIFLGGWVDAFLPKMATRWSVREGELPLLALLPSLGGPTVCKRATLLACLRFQAAWSAPVLIAFALIGAVLGAPWTVYPLLAVVAVSGLALNAAMITYVLAGRPLRGAMRLASKATVFALLMATILLWVESLPHENPGSMAAGSHQYFAYGAIALWVVWLVLMVALALRGWRLLQHRPHPFLANAPQ